METVKVFMLASLAILFSNAVLIAGETPKNVPIIKTNEKNACVQGSPLDPRHEGSKSSN